MAPQSGLRQIEISFEAEGNGVMVGANGDVVTWRGGGNGRMIPTPDGGYTVAYGGAVYYASASSGALAAFNGKVGVFEYDIDASNKTAARIYEWR